MKRLNQYDIMIDVDHAPPLVDSGKSRQFSSKEVKTKIDNSVWTDTPEDKQRKLKERLSGKKRSREQDDEEPEPVRMSQRDLEMQRQVQEYNVS